MVAAEGARRGSRARLELGVRAVLLGDRRTALRARSEPIIAGSTRARNLGAIAGGAAAGALIGKATGDNAGKGALIGGALACLDPDSGALWERRSTGFAAHAAQHPLPVVVGDSSAWYQGKRGFLPPVAIVPEGLA